MTRTAEELAARVAATLRDAGRAEGVESRAMPTLEIHGAGDAGTAIDVRSPGHMMCDRDPRIAPWPALVGWVNVGEDCHGTPVYAATYAGPSWRSAIKVKFAAFGDPAEAVQWIAVLFSEEGN